MVYCGLKPTENNYPILYSTEIYPSFLMDTSTPNSSVVVPNLIGFLKISLDRSDYPLWLAQISPILNMKSLMEIVDEAVKCPLQFKLSDNSVATTEVNPAYEDWRQKDQLVLSWINNSHTLSVLSTVALQVLTWDISVSWKICFSIPQSHHAPA